MGMSTHVVGFRPADDKWMLMLNIYNACEEANVSIPLEVSKFFEHTNPNNKPGLNIDIKPAVTPFKTDYQDGFDIDITKLPNDLKIIRFYNSW